MGNCNKWSIEEIHIFIYCYTPIDGMSILLNKPLPKTIQMHVLFTDGKKLTGGKGLSEPAMKGKQGLVEGMDFKVVRLDAGNVAKNKKNVRKEGKAEGERLFQQALSVMRDNFPASEIENESQFRSYFHDAYRDSWFVKVAVNSQGEVIGLRTYSYKEEMNLIMLNITVVKKEFTQQGVSRALENDMIRHAEQIGIRNCKDVSYAIAEVERPDFVNFTGEEGVVRNVVRPAYHDKVSMRWPLILPNGEPFIYLLPIMATDAERKEAIEKGEPIEPEPLMFCIRPIAGKREDGMNFKELARLILWFYKGYLGQECTDVKINEVNALCAEAIGKLCANGQKGRILGLLEKRNKRNASATDSEILSLVPGIELYYAKVSETAIRPKGA